MQELMIFEFQAKEIENALRLAMNTLNSREGKTCLDRTLIQADKFIKSVLREQNSKTTYKEMIS